MKHAYVIGICLAVMSCHEPCKNDYGRAADGLCYPLAEDPVAPCGEGMGRNDDGECLPFGEMTDTASDLDGSDGDGDLLDDGSDADADADADAGSDGDADDADAGSDGDADADAGSDGDADADSTVPDDTVPTGGATINGALLTSDVTGFASGESVILYAWTEDAIDTETGWPLGEDSVPLATQTALAAVTAMSIHYTFEIPTVPSGGVLVRLTASLDEATEEGEIAPRGAYPEAVDEWLFISPSSITDGITITIDNGDPAPDVEAPPLDEGAADEMPGDEGPPPDGEPPPGDSDEGSTPADST